MWQSTYCAVFRGCYLISIFYVISASYVYYFVVVLFIKLLFNILDLSSRIAHFLDCSLCLKWNWTTILHISPSFVVSWNLKADLSCLFADRHGDDGRWWWWSHCGASWRLTAIYSPESQSDRQWEIVPRKGKIRFRFGLLVVRIRFIEKKKTIEISRSTTESLDGSRTPLICKVPESKESTTLLGCKQKVPIVLSTWKLIIQIGITESSWN